MNQGNVNDTFDFGGSSSRREVRGERGGDYQVSEYITAEFPQEARAHMNRVRMRAKTKYGTHSVHVHGLGSISLFLKFSSTLSYLFCMLDYFVVI